jgi:hypothetical protein
MKLLFIVISFIILTQNLFSLGRKENSKSIQYIQNIIVNDDIVNIDQKNSEELIENSIIIGKVRIYGNEPHTFVGIIDENGVEYAIYPQDKEEELRNLQGYLIEFNVIFVNDIQSYSSLFLKGGIVTPVRWKIIE